MSEFLIYALVPIAIGAVAVVLLLGLHNMARGALFADRPDGQHYDDDRDELQQHAKPHQLLRSMRRAAARHVV